MNPWAFGNLSSDQQRVALSRMAIPARKRLYVQLIALQRGGLAGPEEDLGSWLSKALGSVGGSLGPLAAGLTAFIPGVGPIIAPLVGAAVSSMSAGKGAAAFVPAQPQTSPPPTAPQAASGGLDKNTMLMIAAGLAAILLLKR